MRCAARFVAPLLLVSASLAVSTVAKSEAADALPTSTAEDVGMSTERLERIVPAMQEYVDQGKLPGVVTLVARRGQIVHFEAIGRQNVAEDQPMTKDTIFRIYSQSKPITGVATMILFEEGRFLLSDPVSRYLPEYKEMKVYLSTEDGQIQTENAQPIRIHHLLTHTAGLSYGFFPNAIGAMYNRAGIDNTASLAEWSQELAKLPLMAQPGTEWNYSVAMDVLGRLVEAVSGQSFGEFLADRIFAPLGMVDTAFWVPADKIHRFAANYAPTPDGKMVLADDPATSTYLASPSIEMGGGGLVSTAADYVRFAQMLADGGELNGVRILSPTTVKLMMSNHLGPGFPPDPLSSLFGMMAPGSERALGVGFGLTGSVVTDPALTRLPGSKGTFAWGGAASTDFWVDPEEDLVGMVLTQLIPAGTYPTRQLMQVLTYQAIVD